MPKLSPRLKRLLSIAFFAALVFFGAKIFSVESADCEIVFRLRGPEMPKLQEMEVRLFEKGEAEVLGSFRKYYENGSVEPLGNWPLVVSEGDYLLECDLISADGLATIKVPVKLVDGEAVSVYLDPHRPSE